MYGISLLKKSLVFFLFIEFLIDVFFLAHMCMLDGHLRAIFCIFIEKNMYYVCKI